MYEGRRGMHGVWCDIDTSGVCPYFDGILMVHYGTVREITCEYLRFDDESVILCRAQNYRSMSKELQ